MSNKDFHNEPFGEGTLTKLRIFELYAEAWLPVFLSQDQSGWSSVHLFDFFAGPGTDSADKFGSPLLLLQCLKACQSMKGWSRAKVHVHFFDESKEKIQALKENIKSKGLQLPDVHFDIQALTFDKAFSDCSTILAEKTAAKLAFLDQFGVDQVTPDVFLKLVNSPTCDFLFFLSTWTLHRFRDIPAIKLKIVRPDDHFHVHRAALDYYRGLLPRNKSYFLAPFSIKKGGNIYGIIFGSAHPLGMDKFLQVTWKRDEISGEADFDIDRDNIRPGQNTLAFFKPTKIAAFESELEYQLKAGALKDENDVTRICFEHGVKRQHAEPVLSRLRMEGVIELAFKVPDMKRLKSPRPIRMKRKPNS